MKFKVRILHSTSTASVCPETRHRIGVMTGLRSAPVGEPSQCRPAQARGKEKLLFFSFSSIGNSDLVREVRFA